VTDTRRGPWSRRAEAFLEAALDDVRSELDAIANVSAGMACLRIEAGELPADDDLAAMGDDLLDDRSVGDIDPLVAELEREQEIHRRARVIGPTLGGEDTIEQLRAAWSKREET